jgi:glycosyltransferase 2 family protein
LDIAGKPAGRKRVRFLYWVIALALAAAFLYYSVRGIDWRAVGEIVLRIHIQYVFVTAALGAAAMFLRAMRWRLLLQAEAPVRRSTAFWATAAGYFGNSFLPARAGELVRTYAISASSTLGKAYVLTTALAERVSDAIALVTISAVILLTMQNRPGWLEHAARPFAIIGLAGALGIAILPRLEPLYRSVLDWIPLPQMIRSRVDRMLTQALLGIRSFHDFGRMVRFLSLTAMIWCMDAVGTVVLARAFDLSLSLPVAFLLITGMGLGSALPSTPGYVGIYQFVAVSILVPFGFSRTSAIAYILAAQAFQYVGTAIWGAIALWRLRKSSTLTTLQKQHTIAR